MAVRVLLSIAVIFQLMCMLITPISGSYLGIKFRPLVEPYLSFFEFTNSWSFFAPDPGPPPVFIEYELLDEHRETIKRGSFPDRENPFFLRDRQNRRIAAVEFMLGAEPRVERMMLPYLCGLQPKVHSVNIWKRSDTIPLLQDVIDGKRKIGDEIGFERTFISHSFCQGIL